ncbi:chaperone DnaJ domain protein [Syntrophobotulus glycolicus DSM 8271]|uniref:Chaperone DnaJ domain protein n=1 Tax=Syntrophobotulus glycolicus (strain DSM 8271 / FlGlyR) TaxID=645991 RepID=F0T033_SYNGF|nr:DnaJ C-terminal domain-containing protein [Syntrophobotulus glycolicus]ADY56120.1 chaperone DnaJ domain protein [Syntrophobotulus glycolicus DSM 8271]
MDFKDYYSVLGVAPTADIKEIKKKYKELAKKYHPDKNPGDKKSEEKFKEVNEAYQAVGDPAKRQKYDELRQDYQHWQNQGGRGSYDWGAWQAAPNSGTYSRTMSPEDFSDLFGEYGGYSDFFSNIFGMGGKGFSYGAAQQGRRSRKGNDLEGEIEISLEEAFQGTTRLINIGPNRRIQAKVPPGVRDNSKIRLAGQGKEGVNGGQRGDLFLKIRIAPHPSFIRENDDLSLTVPVDFYTAVLGGEIKVKTINGEVKFNLPANTQNGKSIRLKGKGMPILKDPKNHGDLYLKIAIVLPETMAEGEIEALRELYAKYHNQ